MHIKLRRLLAAATVISGLTASAVTSAATWPARPVTLVVPFAPGGSTDTAARIVASALGEVLGKAVVVENRPGAGGNIAAGFVAQTPKDGYTYLFATNAQAAGQTLYRNLSYDLKRDFTPVALAVSFPSVLVVPSNFPAKTLEEFVDYVAKKKGALNYGSAGNGSAQHLVTALFNKRINGEMNHVPFKGGGPANVALLSGDIQAIIGPVVEEMPYINDGKFRALGVSTTAPAPLYPNVPPIATVLPGFDITMWSGVLAPTGTPPAIIEQFNAAMRQVLQKPEIVKKLTAMGFSIYDKPVGDLKDFLGEEVDRWGKMVEISGAEIN